MRKDKDEIKIRFFELKKDYDIKCELLKSLSHKNISLEKILKNSKKEIFAPFQNKIELINFEFKRMKEFIKKMQNDWIMNFKTLSEFMMNKIQKISKNQDLFFQNNLENEKLKIMEE